MTNILVEDLSVIKKKVTFEVPEERMTSLMDAEYRDLKKNVQIKGFRKGKVPFNILRSYFKTQVEADVVRKLIDETFEPGLDEKKLTAVSVLSIDPESIEAGKPFKYTAEIEVPPPVEPHGYKGLKLTKTIRSVDEAQVDERLQRLRQGMASLNPIPEERGVEQGDHLVVDIKAKVEGATIPSLTVSDYHMEVGRNFYLPEFDVNVEGMKPEETKHITMNLPDEFPRKEFAGKTADFEVTVREAKVQVLPDLDDDFAKDLGTYETLADLKKDVSEDISRMLESETSREIRDQVIDQLVELHEFEVPESMVENQIDQMINQSMRNLAAQGIDPDRLPPPTKEQRDRIRPPAIRTVKAGLILKAIGEEENVEVSDEEIEKGIEKKAKEIGFSPDLLKDRWKENNLIEDFRAALVEDKIYELIQEHAEITEQEPPAEDEATQEKTEEE